MKIDSVNVSVGLVRDLVVFADTPIRVSKQGSGLVHVYAKDQDTMESFAAMARVHRVEVSLLNSAKTAGVISRSFMEWSA